MENQEVPKKENRGKKILIIIVGLILLGSVGNIFLRTDPSYKRDQDTASKQTLNTPAPEPTKSIIKVDSKELLAAYDKNKIAAQDKYTGKIIQTSGYIQNISNNSYGNYYIQFIPTADYIGTSMYCYFAHKEDILPLSNRSIVTIMGIMKNMTLGKIYIDNCSVVK